MRVFGLTATYVLGMLVLASLSIDQPWQAIAGLIVVAAGASIAFGFLARHWIVLAIPPCLGAFLFALGMAIGSNASGDGGAEAVAAVLVFSAAVSFLQSFTVGTGVGLAYLLRSAPPERGRRRTH